ncbi:hypothetical protein [Malaciobacter molluscorum]|uniref:hypothetical protein n=1 Tax=Malaciobacter molluscorum TaxID=1032072 RepID=UPI00174D718B|nr:hypothetical protein [Malaciobacter molluscorum]
MNLLQEEREIIVQNEIANNEIIFELKKHLATYMIPSKIFYKKSLPLVPSDRNKINKEILKEDIINNI